MENLKDFIIKYKNKIKKHSNTPIIRVNSECSIPTEKNLFNYFISNFVSPILTDSSLINKINEIKDYINN